jgi:hypothetical protein
MLEVLPIQDKNVQEALCLRCAAKFDPKLMAYAAFTDGNAVGLCQFSMKLDEGTIYSLSNVSGCNDKHALFVICRAVLNFMDLCGVRTTTYEADNIDNDLPYSIGFSKKSDGVYEINLTHFSDHP